MQVLRQISVADRLVLLVTDCLITLEAELVSDMKHPFCVHMCVWRTKQLIPMKERKPEWKDRLGCWERMSASTLAHSLPLTPAIVAFGPWRWDGWRAAQPTPELVATSHHQEKWDWTVAWTVTDMKEGGKDYLSCACILKSWKRYLQVLPAWRISIIKLYSNQWFFFLLLLFIWLPFPYFNLQSI